MQFLRRSAILFHHFSWFDDCQRRVRSYVRCNGISKVEDPTMYTSKTSGCYTKSQF